MDALTQLCDFAVVAQELYYRLIIIVGKGGQGKTTLLRQAAPHLQGTIINLGTGLSVRLLACDESKRSRLVTTLMRDLLADTNSDPVLLDNLEVLFLPELQIDPMSLLQQLSRNRTLIATWRGEVRNGALFYAQPGHPEYRRYPLTADMLLVDLNQERNR